MIINVVNEVTYLSDGTYTAEIETVHGYEENNRVLMKFRLEDNTIFVKFYKTEDISSYPWANIFRALNSCNTDDLIGKKIEFEVKNNSRNEKEYSNIKKVKLV